MSWLDAWSSQIAPEIIPLSFPSVKIHFYEGVGEKFRRRSTEKRLDGVNCKGQKEVAERINKIKLLP